MYCTVAQTCWQACKYVFYNATLTPAAHAMVLCAPCPSVNKTPCKRCKRFWLLGSVDDLESLRAPNLKKNFIQFVPPILLT